MAPPQSDTAANSSGLPHPSFIQVAKPYLFEHAIQKCVRDIGVSQTREDNVRLSGVVWIDNVRKALRLPVRTFDTAVVYYHKFRLIHPDTEYSYVDAAAAALFTACKIEDTLKKSRDILAAAYNLKVPPAEHLSPDDALFENHSRTIIGLERLMLEASGFDFRNRHPQQTVIKLAKEYGFVRSSAVAKTAYQISLDLYRTFAPLKQSTATLAFACLELSSRIHRSENESLYSGADYKTWNISRAEVMETILDLLELYTHHRTLTLVGPSFTIEAFLEARIPLNNELSSSHLPRFTESSQSSHPSNGVLTNGTATATANSSSSMTSPTENNNNNNNNNTNQNSSGTNGNVDSSPSAQMNPTMPNGRRARIGEKDFTVRFMLNPEREAEEKSIVREFFKEEMEEVEVEVGENGRERERERERGPERDREFRRERERERERDRDRDRERERDRYR
ncbi:MAG: hypothetical protein Q9227_001539 [Pyrenula ochraceoflavens]